MEKHYSIKIAGPAGYGIMESGRIFGQALASLGLSVLVYPEYPSRIRGGDNVAIVDFGSQGPVLPEGENDLVAALSVESLVLHRSEVKLNGQLIVDSDFGSIENEALVFPLTQIAEKLVGRPIARNMVCLGVLFGLLDLPIKNLESQVKANLASKGKEVVMGNLAAVRAGYQQGQGKTLGWSIDLPLTSPAFLYSGNEALTAGIIAAQCDYAAIYPMTPINSILTELAEKEKQTGMIIFRPEDEIAGINSAIGASFAGKRSLVASSGGGFSLMIEGLAMAGATETPLVVIEGTRAGPSSGMATWTSQEDLLFLISAGNGEFPRIVLTPGDIEEAYRLMFAAFNLADIYQLPVIVVTDKYLSESSFSTSKALDKKNWPLVISRGKLLAKPPQGDYQRYQLSADGISPRAVPGQAVFLTNSYVHDQAGFSAEDGPTRIAMKEKLFKKIVPLDKEAGSQLYGDEKAKLTLVGFGSTKSALLLAWQDLVSGGVSVNFLHIFRPWPFPAEVGKILSGAKKIIVVENNSQGQLATLIKSQTGQEAEKILKDDGRPFLNGEIEERLKAFYPRPK
jgi:2-oxoglutarate ferredoxin oxidoreductase subunit alpha